MFYLEIHYRKVFNAERVNWRQYIKGKALRAARGPAYLCEGRFSGVVDQVGTWLSLVVSTRLEPGKCVLS